MKAHKCCTSHATYNLFIPSLQSTRFIQIVVILPSFTKQCFLILRLGVDAFGYEDKDVRQLRCNLSAFLRDGCTKKGLHIQIATVTALLGLLSLNFEEIIQDNVKFPVNASESSLAVVIREWFSLLSKKQQDLAINFLQTGGVNSK